MSNIIYTEVLFNELRRGDVFQLKDQKIDGYLEFVAKMEIIDFENTEYLSAIIITPNNESVKFQYPKDHIVHKINKEAIAQ